MMPCHMCHGVAVPDSDPALCPDCLVATTPSRLAARTIGLDEQPISIDEAFAATDFDPPAPEYLRSLEQTFTFHVTDLGDLAVVPKGLGVPQVWTADDAGRRQWLQWDDYLALNM